jgi:hypothetical protein
VLEGTVATKLVVSVAALSLLEQAAISTARNAAANTLPLRAIGEW